MELKNSQCSKCYQNFQENSDFYIFNCSHNFCKECLFQSFFITQFDILQNYISQTNNNDLIIPCSICKKGTFIIKSNNFIKILKLSENNNNKKNIPNKNNIIINPLCKKHKNVSEVFCEQCEQWFCKECIKIHNEIGNSHHNLLNKKNTFNTKIKCNKHENKIKFYCENCNELICNDCCELEHKLHKFLNLREFLNNAENNIDFNKMKKLNNIIFDFSMKKSNFEKIYSKYYKNLIYKMDEIINNFTKIKLNFIQQMNYIHLKQNNLNEIILLSFNKIDKNIENFLDKNNNKKKNIHNLLFLNNLYKFFDNINENNNNNNININNNDYFNLEKKFKINNKNINKLNKILPTNFTTGENSFIETSNLLNMIKEKENEIYDINNKDMNINYINKNNSVMINDITNYKENELPLQICYIHKVKKNFDNNMSRNLDNNFSSKSNNV